MVKFYLFFSIFRLLAASRDRFGIIFEFSFVCKCPKSQKISVLSIISIRTAFQKGIKDNSRFQKVGRTIRTKIICDTKVRKMYMGQ